MSASRERKERANNKVVAQPTKKQEPKKVSEGLILAISVIAILVAVFGTVLGIRFYQRNQVVMTVGDKDVTVREFNYFYNQTASNFGNYASYLGIDTSKPVDDQTVASENVSMMSMLGMDIEVLAPYKQEDGTYDITWAGYFALLARETCAQTWAVYQAAEADPNYQIPEDIETSVKNEIMNLDLYRQIYGMKTTDDFIEAQYGDGCNAENYEQHIRVSYVASDYATNYKYNAADIDAKYASATADFDVVSYLVYTAKASDYLSTEEAAEETETESDKETVEDAAAKAEAMEKAKADAEAMAKDFVMEGKDITAHADQLLADAKISVTEEAATWMFETAKAGDIKMFEDVDNDRYLVVKVLSNDVNYQTINGLQIYIPVDDENVTEVDHTGHDHAADEIPEEEIVLTAAEKLEAVKSGLAADGSEESFRELATKHSGGNTVDMKDVSYTAINDNISMDALLWVMAERKAGDYEVFETESGTYVLYYTGTGETYRNLRVNATLVTDYINELTETAVTNCKFDLAAALNGAVDLKLQSNAQG